MARRKITTDEKLARAQEEMYKAKARYEAKQDEVKALLEQKAKEDLDYIDRTVDSRASQRRFIKIPRR